MTGISTDLIRPQLPIVCRIRMGQEKTGRGPGRPLNGHFRVSCDDRSILAALAALELPPEAGHPRVGGEVHPSKSNGSPEAFQLITEAPVLPVIPVAMPGVPNGGIWHQSMELWGGSTCLRRCTGGKGDAALAEKIVHRRTNDKGQEEIEVESLPPQPCRCRAQALEDGTGPAEWDCKPVTRLYVVIPGIDLLGAAALTTSSWDAAGKLPGSIEFAAAALGGYEHLIGEKCLLRTTEHPTKPNAYVPRLEVRSSIDDLIEKGSAARAALLEGRGRPAGELEAGAPPLDAPDGAERPPHNPETGEVLDGEVVQGEGEQDPGEVYFALLRDDAETFGLTAEQARKALAGLGVTAAAFRGDGGDELYQTARAALEAAAAQDGGGVPGGAPTASGAGARREPDDPAPAPSPHPGQEALA